jgi:threonine dehydratase
MRVRPCEPRNFDDTARSLAAGEPVNNAPGATSICDAIMTPHPGQLTFRIMRRLCGPGLVVSDRQAIDAMAQAFSRLKLVAEPGGAVALAAALFAGDAGDTRPVIAVVSGGNVDMAGFQAFCALA